MASLSIIISQYESKSDFYQCLQKPHGYLEIQIKTCISCAGAKKCILVYPGSCGVAHEGNEIDWKFAPTTR